VRYLTSDTNLIADATLAATNIIASQAFETTARDADGGGIVSLTGAYTGADNSVFDIEVTSTTINGAPQISAPVFAGVGNGTISGIGATSALNAQQFTVTVLDTGTETRAAWAPFQSVNLRAQATGSSGNNLSVRISQAGLTATASEYSTTSEMSAGASEFTGDQFNFGAVLLEPEGTVPTTAPRLRFGDDVTVYRHWKTFREGAYRYHLSPALKRPVPIGALVYVITGGRTVEELDGASVARTHTDITTLYSLLAKIAADSTLIEVDGVIAQDRRPGGMACDDLSVYTSSYSAGSARDGTDYIKRAVIPLTVGATSPTEILRSVCIGAPIPGSEIWAVTGSVSGTLDNAISGVAWTGGTYGFTIPQELQPGVSPEGNGSAVLDLLPRTAGGVIPSMCTRNFLLGSEAQTRTYTYEWRPRPAAACDCSTVPISGGPIDDFLGIAPTEGDAMAALPAAIKDLYQEIATWRKGALALNCYFTLDDDDLLATLYAGLRIVDSAAFTADSVADPATYPPAGTLSTIFQRVSVVAKFEEADIKAITMVANFFQLHLRQIYDQMGGSGALDSTVEDTFRTEWEYIRDAMAPLLVATNNGALQWKTDIFDLATPVGGTTTNSIEEYMQRAIAGAKNLTSNLEPLLRRCEAGAANAYIAGDLLPPFDGATLTGNAVWQDHGGDFWFVSQDGLLPIQPGHYYHSARMQPNADTGEDEPVATREFGFGPAIGCVESLTVGDKLIVTTTPLANGRSTYQEGDFIEWSIVRADPVALGGGQTGDDTITIGVRGSVVGALANYTLVTTSLSSYSNGGVSLTVTPGAIAFQPGDRWTFSAEGGEFRWRLDGGSWTTADIAATVSLSAGITTAFVAGATPSWAVGDTYQFGMLASSGAGKARTPSDESMAWTGSTQIDIATSGTADTVLLAAHTIPSSATVTLTGSDDNFATTKITQVVPWATGSMAALFASTTCAKWRLTVNATGSIGWLYLGVPERPIVSGTAATVEHGTWARRTRLATGQRTRALGGTINHESCSQASIDDLLTALEYAHTNDDSRIGVVSAEGEATLCTVADEIDIDDALGFQPAAESRRLNLAMTLTPR